MTIHSYAVPREAIGLSARTLAFSISVLLVLFLGPFVAAEEMQTGYFEHPEPGGLGPPTNYRVYYELPKVFLTNRTEQVRIWMNVTHFSQTTSEVEAQSIEVVLTIGKMEFPKPGGQLQMLKAGQIWGPFTFEFLVTDVEVGLGPSETIDIAIRITVKAVEYWHPLIGSPVAYPKTFSNEKQILAKMINPEKKMPPSSSDILSWILQQLSVSFVQRLLAAAFAAGLVSLSIRYTMPRQFLPLLLAVGSIFVLVGVLLPMYELSIFGAVLVVTAIILYIFTHKEVFV